MNYIVYVSQSREPMDPAALRALLDHSRKRNFEDGITGLLIYRYNAEFERGNFMQVIEGPEAALNALWSRIAQDRRHHTIVNLQEGDAPERMFETWSMGFRNIEDREISDHPGYADIGTDAFWQRVEREALPDALDFLRSFYVAA